MRIRAVLQFYRTNDNIAGSAYGAVLVPPYFGTAVLRYYRNTAQRYIKGLRERFEPACEKGTLFS